MKKAVYLRALPLFIAIIFCGFSFISCDHKKGNELSSQSGAENQQLDVNLPAMYTGSLPCSDCPSIRYSLIIDKNSFTEISIYDNDPDARFEKNGKWKVNADTLTILDSKKSPIKKFLVSDGALILLDKEHQKSTGSLPDEYTLERTGNQLSIREHHQKLVDQGFKFFAGGNEPFWSVKIDSLNRLIFETPDSTRQFGEADSLKDGNRVILDADAEAGKITIITDDNYCQDSMSGYLFPRTVSVVLEPAKNDTLTGCGLFLNR